MAERSELGELPATHTAPPHTASYNRGGAPVGGGCNCAKELSDPGSLGCEGGLKACRPISHGYLDRQISHCSDCTANQQGRWHPTIGGGGVDDSIAQYYPPPTFIVPTNSTFSIKGVAIVRQVSNFS
jgi:hypothetical protein